MRQLRPGLEIALSLLVLAVLTFGAIPSASAQTIRPRVLVMVDTSGSMTGHFTDNVSTGGDGSTSYADSLITRNLQTMPNGLALYEGYQIQGGGPVCPAPNNAVYDGINSRLFGAKRALDNIINGAGGIDWGLMRYTGTQCSAANPVLTGSSGTACMGGMGGTCAAGFNCVNGQCGAVCADDYSCLGSAGPGTVVASFCVGGTCVRDSNLCLIAGGTYGVERVIANMCTHFGQGMQQFVPVSFGGDCGTAAAALSATCATPQACAVDGDCSGAVKNQCALIGQGPAASCQCGGAFPVCPTNYVCNGGRCAYALGCQSPGGVILVDPSVPNSSAQIPIWIDGVEDYRDAGGGVPTNPELRASGGTPLAGAARTATAWYNNIKNNNLDPKIACRPYVLVQMTDGEDSCDASQTAGPVAAAQAFVAATAPNAKNLNKVYVVGLAFGGGGSATLDAVAAAGGTQKARLASSQADIQAALADIVQSSVFVEKCNGVDDDCNGECDEPFPDVGVSNNGCSNPRAATVCNNGQIKGTKCYAEGKYVCSNDGLSERCDAVSCGNGGVCPSAENAGGCNHVDDDCNGVVDDCTPFVNGSCCNNKCPTCNMAGMPQPETCNGCDDDCDGVVDNNLVDAGQGCGNSIGMCEAGKTFCCQENNPSVGNCSQSQVGNQMGNGDRLVCLGGRAPSQEVCDGVDNNCNGAIDELSQSCYPFGNGTPGKGICRSGTQQCMTMACGNAPNGCCPNLVPPIADGKPCPGAAAFGNCAGAVGPRAEVCNGIDDDCNGQTDDNLTDNWFAMPCCPTGNISDCTNMGGSQTCKQGTYGCNMGNRVCTGAIAKSPDLCNGLDEDCNGKIDDVAGVGGACNGNGFNNTGVCRADWVCTGQPGQGPNGLTCMQVKGPGPEVCNGLDDDCNGFIDDNVIDIGNVCADLCPGMQLNACVGQCKAGKVACANGSKFCSGAVGPSVEVCDGMDNDCNGQTDENVTDPWANQPCCPTGNLGDCMNAGGSNRCQTGSYQCVMGARTCVGGLARQPETCNSIDDDCDGKLDNVPGVDQPCNENGVKVLGPCTATYACSGQPGPGPNGLTCTQLIGPKPELCDGMDNDCDGKIDDNLQDKRVGVVGGAPCTPLPQGQDQAPCNPGTTVCRNGMVACDGEVLPQPNVCGKPPTDCTNNGTPGACQGNLVCCGGATCSAECNPTREFSCMGGFTCDSILKCCVPDPCLKLKCDPVTQYCQEQTDHTWMCVDRCMGVKCLEGGVCVNGICHDCANDPQGMKCPDGQVCTGKPPKCAADPCAGVKCDPGQFCNMQGKCSMPCSPQCPTGKVCQDGSCIDNPCLAKECLQPLVCAVVDGMAICIQSQCHGACATGLACCMGMCSVDPCTRFTCLGDATCKSDDFCNPSCIPNQRDTVVAAGGGGGALSCDVGAGRGGGSSPWALSIAVVLLAAILRRRSLRRALWGVGVAAFALTAGAGCNPNPFCLDCNVGDGGVIVGADGPEGPDLIVGDDGMMTGDDLQEVDPNCVPTNNGIEKCDGVDNDCNHAVDDVSADRLAVDPSNCGACGHACDYLAIHQGGTCVAAVCAPGECLPGFLDLDKDPTNGCEFECTPTLPPTEVCDGRDNDCNGIVDDGFGYPNYASDAGNCGACGNVCSLPGAVSTCVADPNGQKGICVVDHCINDGANTYRHQGFMQGQLNRTGCEYHCPKPSKTTTQGHQDCDNSQCTFDAEVCNSIDDDCDFLADDNPVDVGVPCGDDCPGRDPKNCVGACKAGMYVCNRGTRVCSGSLGSGAEVCNGIDDDCDGTPDDKLTDAWLNQECCPTGNLADCQNTGNGFRCSKGSYQCSGGGRVCSGGVSRTAEICNGIDDDCNGIVDDIGGIGAPCADNGVLIKGACTASYVCNGKPGPGPNGLTCQQGIGKMPELCNGIDDDCNGVTDDNLVDVGAQCGSNCPGGMLGNCIGECKPGKITCESGVKTCTGSTGLAAKICDGLDNDCNGTIDDGFGWPDYNSDAANCGKCGAVCNLPNAITGCHTDKTIDAGGKGVCFVIACNNDNQKGFSYVPAQCGGNTPSRDGPMGVGCNYACPVWPTTVEVCDGKDNNCNSLVDELKSQCAPDGLVPPNNFCATLGVCNGQNIPLVCNGGQGWKCNYANVAGVEMDMNGNLPLTEKLCDNKDGNCNGSVDLDGYPTLGQACAVGVGACQGQGTIVCLDPSTVGCSAKANANAATDEKCDGKDNNCNGLVDERTDYTDPDTHVTTHGWQDPMVQIPKPGGGGASVWVYQYEASRPGSTANTPGGDSSRACSTPGVLPWAFVTETQAEAECEAVKDSTGAKMRLCFADEWQAACEGPGGPAGSKWSISATPTTYVAQICNDVNEAMSPGVWATGSDGAQSMAKGLSCYSDWVNLGQLHDMSGNLAEWTQTPVVTNGVTYFKVRGGSYTSPQNGGTCEFDFDIARPAFANEDVGFRCCSDHAP